MTAKPIPTLIEQEEATETGAQGLAAADLAAQVMRILEQALDASGLDQKALAEKLGVTQGRVSQVLNGDGNLRVAAVARYLRALGYETHLSANPIDPGNPALPRVSRRRGAPARDAGCAHGRADDGRA
jgi:predicted XRE-type DNA-binding protein